VPTLGTLIKNQHNCGSSKLRTQHHKPIESTAKDGSIWPSTLEDEMVHNLTRVPFNFNENIERHCMQLELN
jgi:hypothetical protein